MSRRRPVPAELFADASETTTSPEHARVYAALATGIETVGLQGFFSAAKSASASLRQEEVLLRGRPVEADWIPRIVPFQEYEHLQQGIEQRFQALRAFVKAWLIGQDSVVPDELVPRRPTAVDEPVTLHLYAPDLVRDHDGRLLVLEDNLGHPGAQIYSSLVRDYQEIHLPDLFATVDVLQRADFPQRLGQICRGLAGDRNGELVYLWPGAHDTSEVFEVMRVVAGAGMVLATPNDLSLDRTGQLRVGTPPRAVAAVHVRLRESDPYNSEVLARAAAQGRTVILSPHAQRVVGDKGVHAFVPALIRHYLGEEPILDQPETKWLGLEENRLEVVADLQPWVLKRRRGVGGHEVRFGRELIGDEAATWLTAIAQTPGDFVAQRVVEPSTHTCLVSERLLAVRPIDLRLYALADADHVEVLPLGLTRRNGEGTARSNLANPGTAIKDTWIERGRV